MVKEHGGSGNFARSPFPPTELLRDFAASVPYLPTTPSSSLVTEEQSRAQSGPKMAKKNGLSSNPADAARKAARQRELKKNKADREAVREHALVKKDTSTLESEIRHLERAGKTGPELETLKAELKKAKEAKDKYLEKHPEHKKFIYPHSQEQKAEEASDHGRGLFRPDGKPRFPEKSVYYHPVFNPWGAPPPGMPYAEKPPHEWASSSQMPPQPPPPSAGGSLPTEASDSEDGDDDIMMPTGPPPTTQNGVANASDEESDDDDDDDDLVMPSGPPPSAASLPRLPLQPQQSMQPSSGFYNGPPPYGSRPPPPSHMVSSSGFHHGGAGPMMNRPPYPPHLSQGPPIRPAPRSTPRPGHPYARHPPRPPPPPGFAHPPGPASGAAPSMARPRPPPNAPTGPSAARPGTSASTSAAPSISQTSVPAPSATISSAPQLRDFKKEAVTFLPPSVRKQKSKAQQKAKMAGLSRSIRANPDVGDEEQSGQAAIEGDSSEREAQQEAYTPSEEADMNEEEEERREPEVSLEAAQSYVPSVQEASSRGSTTLKRPSPPATAIKKATAMPSLVGYYDSDEDGSDEDGVDEGGVGLDGLDESDPHNQEREELPPPPKFTTDSTVSKAMPAKGRVNLVEALKAQLPASAQPKKADGDYEKWLQSIGGA